MMTEQELQQMQALRDEIATLRSEIDADSSRPSTP